MCPLRCRDQSARDTDIVATEITLLQRAARLFGPRRIIARFPLDLAIVVFPSPYILYQRYVSSTPGPPSEFRVPPNPQHRTPGPPPAKRAPARVPPERPPTG